MKTGLKNMSLPGIILAMAAWALGLSILVGPSWLAYADYPDMEMNASPNPVGSGARALGIGGAFISIADDATAASWNPGGLLQLLKPEISIVGSYFSGSSNYDTEGANGDIEDRSPDIKHLNYMSAAVPFMIRRYNLVFSLNYQHLYEFSHNTVFQWKETLPQAMIDAWHEDHKHQSGSLHTVSPALAIQIHRRFSLGLTANLWNLPDNGWENITIQYAEGQGLYGQMKEHKEVYEKYDFSGFNMHLGFLFRSRFYKLRGRNMRFRIGGVIKTPFEGDIRHEKREFLSITYPDNPVKNEYYEKPATFKDLTLRMPLSYGLGVSFDFSQYFSLALDVYRTHWENYLLIYPSREEWSPINRKLREEADIKPTTQVRLGAEYLIENARRKIPLRFGVFYDPEPAGGRPDDFYGLSFGSGIIYPELFSLDFAYQLRFGNKRQAEILQNESISSRVTQHYFYISVIFYAPAIHYLF